MKKIVIILSALCLLLSAAACGKTEREEPASGELTSASETVYGSSYQTELPSQSETAAISSGAPETQPPTVYTEPDTTAQSPEPTAQSPVESKSQAETGSETESAETTTELYKRTGTMQFSDSADNKYLAAVASKYSVDPKYLAAIYTVPDANGNIVLRFDGSADASGKLIRNADTLVAIYSIDKEMNSKCASEDTSINEYNYVEMKTMFFTTTTYIIPKFENVL